MKVDYHYVLWYKLFLFIFCFYYRMFCLFAFTIDLSVNFCISVSHFLPFGINIFSSCFGITFFIFWYHIFHVFSTYFGLLVSHILSFDINFPVYLLFLYHPFRIFSVCWYQLSCEVIISVF